jgi:hypothetical protein
VETLTEIPLTQIALHPMLQIRRRWQPDTDPGLATLMQSLDGPEGLIHPVVVVPCPDTTVFGSRPYTLVAGHRRLEAARRLGWSTIPVRILAPCDLTEPTTRLRLFAMAVRENTERRDLHPTDRREALIQLKQFYEAVYPAALTRGPRRTGNDPATAEPTPPAFPRWAAQTTRIPERTIRRDLRITALGTRRPQVAATAATPLSAESPVPERLQQAATAGLALTRALRDLAPVLTPDAPDTAPPVQLEAAQQALRALQEAIDPVLTRLAQYPSPPTRGDLP